MEYKNLKTNVFSIDTVFNESAEQPVDADFTLPDYYPDISKVLNKISMERFKKIEVLNFDLLNYLLKNNCLGTIMP